MKRILFYLCFTCFFYQVFSQSHNLPLEKWSLANIQQLLLPSAYEWLSLLLARRYRLAASERLNRDEAEYYLEQCKQAGFNVVQVQTINGVPAMNFYGQSSMPDGFDFSISTDRVYMDIGIIWTLSSMPPPAEGFISAWSASGAGW